MRRRACAGQMTVELAVVLPVVIVMVAAVVTIMRYVACCATFDHVALDAVVAYGTSPAGSTLADNACSEVRQTIVDALASDACDVQVSATKSIEDGQPGHLTINPLLVTYTCKLTYRPLISSVSVAGATFTSPVALTHERTLVIDRYRPGVVI